MSPDIIHKKDKAFWYNTLARNTKSEFNRNQTSDKWKWENRAQIKPSSNVCNSGLGRVYQYSYSSNV